MLILVVGLMALYLIGANLFLNVDRLSSLVSRRPEKMLVEWESGWTVIPGFVHIEGLRIRGQSAGKQWQCRLSEGNVQLSFLPLARKTFQVRRARGGDFEFVMRRRLNDETKDLPAAEFFPGIEGYLNPPDPAPEDIYPPKDKTKRGWKIDLSDIRFDGDVTLWFGRLKIAGTGTVGGGLDFQIRGLLHVPQALFDLDDGSLAIDGKTMVQDLDISADVVITPMKPNDVKGTAVFNHVLGSWALENGEIPDLQVVNWLLPATSALRLESGTASFSWNFDKPSIEAGSTGDVEIVASGADMSAAGRGIGGDFSLRTHLVRGSLAEGRWDLGETTMALENILIDLPGGEGQEAGASEPWWMRTTLRAGAVDLGDPGVLAAEVQFAMKNTDPLLELFMSEVEKAGEAKMPRWVKLLPDLQNLEGRATLDMDERGTIVDDVVIEADKFLLMARLKAADEALDGQLYVRYRGFHLGLDMRDGKSDLKILRPRQWFLGQPEFDESGILEPPVQVDDPSGE